MRSAVVQLVSGGRSDDTILLDEQLAGDKELVGTNVGGGARLGHDTVGGDLMRLLAGS